MHIPDKQAVHTVKKELTDPTKKPSEKRALKQDKLLYQKTISKPMT